VNEDTLTMIYLYPAIHFGYDEKFRETMTELINNNNRFVINMYLGDIDEPDIPYSIFVLFDKTSTKNFDVLLNYFYEHISFVYDYEIDSKLHMIVLQMPEEHCHTYEMFRESKYSKMYKPEFINKHKAILANSITYLVNGTLKKKTRLEIFLKMPEREQFLKKEYDVDELASEYEELIKIDTEIFNRKIYYKH